MKLLWNVQFLLKFIPFLWEFVANNAQENPGVLLLKNPGVGVFKIRENPGVFGVGVPRGGNPKNYNVRQLKKENSNFLSYILTWPQSSGPATIWAVYAMAYTDFWKL